MVSPLNTYRTLTLVPYYFATKDNAAAWKPNSDTDRTAINLCKIRRMLLGNIKFTSYLWLPNLSIIILFRSQG